MNFKTRRPAAIAATAATLAAGLLATAAPALAWTGPSRVISSRSAPLDWCPGNAAICADGARLTTLGPNTAINMVCWIDARTDGFTYPRWFYVTSVGYQGFIKAELVANQNPSTPSCLSNATGQLRAIAASLQATGLSEIYQRYPTATDKTNAWNVYRFNHWGTYGDWSGDCVMFTALAWWRAGQKVHAVGNAEQIGSSYSLHGGTPPRGAAVFWHWGSLGHMAISLGNGMVVTTQGGDDDRLITTQAWISTLSAHMAYRGWTPIP